MYTFQSRIRYSETGDNGLLTMEGLLDYFQDCSTFHSEDLGLGVDYLRKEHLVWVLSSWQIVVERYPALGERVEIGTFPYEFKAFMGFRNFFLKDENGCFIAKANSVWTLLHSDTFRPVKPAEEMLKAYVIGPKLEMEYAPRKISIPEGGEYGEEIEVKKHHLDTNHHVNNGQYVRMAMDFLPENVQIRQMRAEYKMQARLGDKMKPYIAKETDKFEIALLNAERQPYANIEFRISRG